MYIRMFSEQYNYGCEKLSKGGWGGGWGGVGRGFSSQTNSIFYSIDSFPGHCKLISLTTDDW